MIKIATNTLVQTLGRTITSGVTFLTTILIAREFGAEGFGDFTKITNFVATFYLLSDFGFNAIFLQKKYASFSKLVTMRFLISIALVLFSIAISFALPYNENQGFPPPVRIGIVIYAFTIIAQALFTSANVLFQKNLSYDKSVTASTIGSLTTLLLVLFATNQNFLLTTIVGVLVVGSVVTTLASFVFVKKYALISLDFDWVFTKRLIKSTLPLGLTLVFNLIYVRADWFILTLLRPTWEVGVYGLAYKFFEFPLSLPIFFNDW